MSYDTESKSRNADFISIARRAIHNPRAQRARQTYEPSGLKGLVNLKNLFLCPLSEANTTLLHNPRRKPRPFFGGERSEPIRRIVFMPYGTESKSRNVLASPLGEEGHEVAKGCTRVRMIMTLDMDVTAAGVSKGEAALFFT